VAEIEESWKSYTSFSADHLNKKTFTHSKDMAGHQN